MNSPFHQQSTTETILVGNGSRTAAAAVEKYVAFSSYPDTLTLPMLTIRKDEGIPLGFGSHTIVNGYTTEPMPVKKYGFITFSSPLPIMITGVSLNLLITNYLTSGPPTPITLAIDIITSDPGASADAFFTKTTIQPEIVIATGDGAPITNSISSVLHDISGLSPVIAAGSKIGIVVYATVMGTNSLELYNSMAVGLTFKDG